MTDADAGVPSAFGTRTSAQRAWEAVASSV